MKYIFSYQNFPKSLLENGANELSFIPANIDSSVTWEDLKWLKSITRLPIVLKGILRGMLSCYCNFRNYF